MFNCYNEDGKIYIIESKKTKEKYIKNQNNIWMNKTKKLVQNI